MEGVYLFFFFFFFFFFVVVVVVFKNKVWPKIFNFLHLCLVCKFKGNFLNFSYIFLLDLNFDKFTIILYFSYLQNFKTIKDH